jgi:ketosteroid isomerase-like protein
VDAGSDPRYEVSEACRTLLADYAAACDAKDLRALEGLFSPEIVVSVPGSSWEGLDAALGFFREAWGDSKATSRHFITNVAVRRADRDSAEATASFLYLTGIDGRSMVGWGSYLDTIRRHEGRFVIATKHITMDALVDANEGWAAAMHGGTGT